MYVPFLVVLRAAGAPLYPAILLLAYFSNLAVADPLRDHASADSLWCWLREAANLVEARPHRIGCQRPDLDDPGFRMVENSGSVVRTQPGSLGKGHGSQ